jgi:hypothetical protein
VNAAATMPELLEGLERLPRVRGLVRLADDAGFPSELGDPDLRVGVPVRLPVRVGALVAVEIPRARARSHLRRRASLDVVVRRREHARIGQELPGVGGQEVLAPVQPPVPFVSEATRIVAPGHTFHASAANALTSAK